jgi:hypothetical protein
VQTVQGKESGLFNKFEPLFGEGIADPVCMTGCQQGAQINVVAFERPVSLNLKSVAAVAKQDILITGIVTKFSI